MTMESKPKQTQMAEFPVNEEERLKTTDAEEAKMKETAAEANKLEEDENVEDHASNDKPAIVGKRPSFKEESNFLSDLKEHEKKALLELQKKLQEAIVGGNILKKDGKEGSDEEPKDYEERELTIWGVSLSANKEDGGADVVLLKFLRARDFKVKDAFEMLQNTLLWRKETKIDTILDEDELGAEFGKAGFIDGVDREGHPICYNVLGVFQDEEMSSLVFRSVEGRKKFLRSRVQLMERGIKKLDMRPGGVSSLLHITDLKDTFGFSKREVRDTVKQAVQLLQDNYPEFVARNVVINVPFWYYALNAVISPFITQRTKGKFVVVRPAKVTETLLKYIPSETIPTQYGGLKRENDLEFSMAEGKAVELVIKAGSSGTIEIPAPETRVTLLWDFVVLGWEVNYKAEFVPSDEGSYTIIVQKGKQIGPQEGPIRCTYRNNEPGKIILTIGNNTLKKKRVFYRYKVKNA